MVLARFFVFEKNLQGSTHHWTPDVFFLRVFLHMNTPPCFPTRDPDVLHDIQTLASDIKSSLFPQGSPEAERLKLDIVRQRHIILRGGRWKQHVTSWLKDRGF